MSDTPRMDLYVTNPDSDTPSDEVHWEPPFDPTRIPSFADEPRRGPRGAIERQAELIVGETGAEMMREQARHSMVGLKAFTQKILEMGVQAETGIQCEACGFINPIQLNIMHSHRAPKPKGQKADKGRKFFLKVWGQLVGQQE